MQVPFKKCLHGCRLVLSDWLLPLAFLLLDALLPPRVFEDCGSEGGAAFGVGFSGNPKDRNCDICLRTKIIRASCRKRTRSIAPETENFGDLITAERKVQSEGCESRNNHGYAAVVVQDLATQWLQSYPCKTKTSQETQKSLIKFLEPARKPKSHLL